MATNLNSSSFILALFFTRKKFPGFPCPPLGLIVVFRGDRCIKRWPCNPPRRCRRHINSACKLDVFLSKVISNGESLYAKIIKIILPRLREFIQWIKQTLTCLLGHPCSIYSWCGAVMTGISLRLAWHSFRPSPLGVQVQGDIALSVLGWVDAKFTPIDMSSLVEPSNQCQPNPNWCHPGSPCIERVSCLSFAFTADSIPSPSPPSLSPESPFCRHIATFTTFRDF